MANELEIIGTGATATVYAYGDGRVLKVFKDSMPFSAIAREAENTRCAHNLGLPAPCVYEIIPWKSRIAVVMEYVAGESLLKTVIQDPAKICAIGEKMAEMQYQLHCTESTLFTSLTEWLTARIGWAQELTKEDKDRFLRLLDDQEPGDKVCHNDFHPDNILHAESGDILIDWCDAAVGNPWADVARTMLIFENTSVPPGTPEGMTASIKRTRGECRKAYEEKYLKLSGMAEMPIRDWRIIVAASRLFCAGPGEKENDLQIVREYLGSNGNF